jgi:hypothetical protein
MFRTVDALNRRKLFSQSLREARPLPFSLETADVAVLLGEPIGNGAQLAILVAKSELGDGEVRIVVQIRDVLADETLLLATLTDELFFVNAYALGQGLDEVSAVNLLMFYAPLIDGEWSLEGAPSAMVGDDENDGSAAEKGFMA